MQAYPAKAEGEAGPEVEYLVSRLAHFKLKKLITNHILKRQGGMADHSGEGQPKKRLLFPSSGPKS